MKRISNSITATTLIAILANALICYFIFVQISGIQSISDEWESVESRNIATAIHLAEVERNFGYVGFIHHFKNYVIRRTEPYYLKAKSSHKKVTAALESFKSQPVLSTQDKQRIKVIEDTLNEYAAKLEVAKRHFSEYSVNLLDNEVKVDDAFAEQALLQLRAEILPRLEKERSLLNHKVSEFRKKTYLVGVWLIPLFLFSTFITIITLRKQAVNVNELTAIFNASPDGIIYVNSAGRISKANETAMNLFGYSPDEFLKLRVEDLVNPKVRHSHVQLRKDFMSEEQMRYMGKSDSKVTGVRKDGSLIELNIAIVSKQLGTEMIGICIIKDMTKLNKLQHKSDTDHLTSLNNRRHLEYILKKELSRAVRGKKEDSLLLIDLDNFKQLNDQKGHLEGDKALKSTAEFLVKHSRECDYISRWGGDEFVIFCPDLKRDEALVFAERLRSDFERFSFGAKPSLSLSIGIASTSKARPLNPTTIIQAADKAVYAVKEAGKNKVLHFNDL